MADLWEGEGRYDWFGWHVGSRPSDRALGRLVETHEYFHRQLDDTTAFGGLMSTTAALSDALEDGRWTHRRDRLQAMSDLVHEAYAVGMSLLTTQRPLVPVTGFPAYDRHVQTMRDLVGDVHPWVALGALRAAAMACMQGDVLRPALQAGLAGFLPQSLERLQRPNHRLVALLAGDYRSAVRSAHADAHTAHSTMAWWPAADGISLRPESLDGDAGDAQHALFARCWEQASAILERTGCSPSPEVGSHVDDLRALLGQAAELAPRGLARIGALVEAPGGELLHGGALDSQTVALSAAPERALVVPLSAQTAFSGGGAARHGFLVLTTSRRVRAAHRLEGLALADEQGALAFLRSTAYEGERPECVVLAPAGDPERLKSMAGETPVYVSVHSSAAAQDSETTERWMRWAEPERLSLVMDTPFTAAVKRWCSTGGRFHTATRAIEHAGMEVRVIVGRVIQGDARSALVVVPTTEFGARWLEAAREEDEDLAYVMVDDPSIFERESDHLDVVLTHLLLEERWVGVGSWRASA